MSIYSEHRKGKQMTREELKQKYNKKIGEEFETEGFKLRVVKNLKANCKGCHFEDKDVCYKLNLPFCNAVHREDKTPVIFVEVSKNKKYKGDKR